jgi:hypothetical protein
MQEHLTAVHGDASRLRELSRIEEPAASIQHVSVCCCVLLCASLRTQAATAEARLRMLFAATGREGKSFEGGWRVWVSHPSGAGSSCVNLSPTL